MASTSPTPPTYSFAELVAFGHYPNTYFQKGVLSIDIQHITEWDVIAPGILELKTITTVEILFGPTTDLTFIMDAIFKKPTIHTLWVSWSSEGEILEKQLNIITKTLNTPHITTFGIYSSNIGDNETKIIAQTLTTNKTLKKFYINHHELYNNHIDLANQLILANAILSGGSLLDFDNVCDDEEYEFEEEVMERIEKGLKRNRHNKRMKEQTLLGGF